MLEPRSFHTRQLQDRDGEARTVGTVVEAPTLELPPAAGLHLPLARPGVAHGKVAVWSRVGSRVESAVYQLDDDHRAASRVACGNALSAVAAAARPDAPMRLVLGDGAIEVHARVVASLVELTWRVPPADVVEGALAGRRWATWRGALNDYLIVGPGRGLGPAVAARFVAHVAGCVGPFVDPLRARVVVLDPSASRVAFYTCHLRAHPSAPLTGLAVLAEARRRLGWLACPDGVTTPRGVMALPEVLADGALRFAPVVVHLEDPSAIARVA